MMTLLSLGCNFIHAHARVMMGGDDSNTNNSNDINEVRIKIPATIGAPTPDTEIKSDSDEIPKAIPVLGKKLGTGKIQVFETSVEDSQLIIVKGKAAEAIFDLIKKENEEETMDRFQSSVKGRNLICQRRRIPARPEPIYINYKCKTYIDAQGNLTSEQ